MERGKENRKDHVFILWVLTLSARDSVWRAFSEMESGPWQLPEEGTWNGKFHPNISEWMPGAGVKPHPNSPDSLDIEVSRGWADTSNQTSWTSNCFSVSREARRWEEHKMPWILWQFNPLREITSVFRCWRPIAEGDSWTATILKAQGTDCRALKCLPQPLPALQPPSLDSEISLQYREGGLWYHTCGGTLIRRNWVMTAAHCVDSQMTFRVAVGDHNLNQNDGTEQLVSVQKVVVHPNWNRNNVAAGYDIALLRLAQNVPLNNYVQLGVLPQEGSTLANNTPCYITGWGKTQTNGQVSQTLQQAYLPSVDYAICSGSSHWGPTVKRTMVCAGGDGIRSGCQGDSGGPLHCLVNGQYSVHGVTSFVSSLGCNVSKKPTVFTRVSAYISWMNTVMASN